MRIATPVPTSAASPATSVNSSTRSISMSPESARPLRAATSMPGCQRSRSLAPSGGGALRERLEDAEHLVDAVAVVVPHGQVADRPVQRGGERAAQLGLRPRLDLARAPPGADGHRAQLAEQHRLADAAQAGEHEAALGPPARHPLEHDLERVDLAVATGQLGGPLTGAGGERVAHRIHASHGIGDSRRFRRSGYRTRWRVVDRAFLADLDHFLESLRRRDRRSRCRSRTGAAFAPLLAITARA